MFVKKSDFEMLKGTAARRLAPLLLLLLTTGCAPIVLFGAGTAAGVAGYHFYEGKLIVLYQAPYMETWDATIKAMNKMNYRIRSADHDVVSGKIVAGVNEDTTVRISVKYKTAKETEVSILVGLMGDEATSNVIKEEIRKALFKV